MDLIDQDERFQDFVVVHELLHLRLPTHGRLFKALLSAHVPGWQAFDLAVGEPLLRGGTPGPGSAGGRPAA